MAKGICLRRLSLVRSAGQGAGKPVLRSIDAVFPAGSVSWVSGPNGAGKSTLLHVIGGLLRPSEGEVFFDDAPVSRWNAGHRDRWRRKVGIVFQHLHLRDDLTAAENVMLPLIPRGLSVRRLRTQSLEALERLGAADLAGFAVRRLSGGQRQRIAVARAVAGDPALLLADEPAAHMDEEGKTLVRVLFADLTRRGAAVVVADRENSPLFAGGGSDAAFFLAAGRMSGPL